MEAKGDCGMALSSPQQRLSMKSRTALELGPGRACCLLGTKLGCVRMSSTVPVPSHVWEALVRCPHVPGLVLGTRQSSGAPQSTGEAHTCPPGVLTAPSSKQRAESPPDFAPWPSWCGDLSRAGLWLSACWGASGAWMSETEWY